MEHVRISTNDLLMERAKQDLIATMDQLEGDRHMLNRLSRAKPKKLALIAIVANERKLNPWRGLALRELDLDHFEDLFYHVTQVDSKREPRSQEYIELTS